MTSPSIGQAIPDFQVLTTGEAVFKLSACQGKKLVLYFYPKDSTPGCTLEGNDFRDNHQEFIRLNTLVFGVSRDSLKSHQNFKNKQCYPFELLSDRDETLCQLFDVIKMKNMYGKLVRGIERSTFVIDENGVLVKEWRKAQVKGHVAEVLAFLQAM